ncbi:MAG: T9SS type A sorting domain-containing protein [Bacteroidota bacterium]
MKKTFILQQASFLLCFLLSGVLAHSQIINLGSLKNYGLFSGAQINLFSAANVDGKAGATVVNNSSFLNASDGQEINTPAYNGVLTELDTLLSQINSLSYTTITINPSSQNYFTAGVYQHNGNLSLNSISHFTGTASDEILIYINGTLELDTASGFDLVGIQPGHIYIFASGGITVKNNSVTYGALISPADISFENNSQGAYSILSRSNIHHINSPASSTVNSFSAQVKIINMTSNAYKLGGVGECANVSTIGGSLSDLAADITIDNSGNYYVTGIFTGTATIFTASGNTTLTALSTQDMFVCRYNADGSIQWVRQAHQTNAGNATGNSIDFNDFGGTDVIYVAGYFDGVADFGTTNTYLASNGAAFILKLDAATGNVIWVKQEGNTNTKIRTMCSDSDGNVYVGGYAIGPTTFSNGNTNNTNAWIAKYDSNSNFQWFVFASPGSSGTIHTIAVSENSGDNKVCIIVEVGGGGSFAMGINYVNLSAGWSNPCLFTFNKNTGFVMWVADLEGNFMLSGENTARALKLTNTVPAEIYVGGLCQTPPLLSFSSINAGAAYILKLNANGSFNSSTQIPIFSSIAPQEPWHDFDIDNSGNLFVIGMGSVIFTLNNILYDSQTNSDIFVFKYDNSLVLSDVIQVIGVGSSSSTDTKKAAIKVDDCRIYTSFSFYAQPLIIDGTTYYSQGSNDGAVATFSNPDDIIITTTGPTQFCQGGSVVLDAGVHPSYQWFLNGVAIPGATSQTYTATQTGYYSVESPTSCCSEATATIFIDVLPAPVVNAGPDITTCVGYNEQLNATGVTNPVIWSPSTFLSNPNIVNPVFNASAPGVYNYTVTKIGSNGCPGSDQITITVNPSPVANAGVDVEFCVFDGAGTTLSGSGGISCVWSPATGLSNTTIYNPVASPSVTTVYTITVTAANGCTASDNVTVNVMQDCCPGSQYFYSGTYSSNIISALPISMSGTINITGPVNIDCPDIRMSPGTVINVVSGTLTVTRSWLHPCNDMWEGIVVQPGASLVMNSYCRVEGAYKAVRSDAGGNFTLDDVLFNRNQTDIYVDPYNLPHTGSVEHCIFTCRDLTSFGNYTLPATTNFFTQTDNQPFYLETNYPTANLMSPLTTIRSQRAMYVTNNNAIVFGTPVNGRKNYVDYHDYGIYAVNTSVIAQNTRFANITGKGLVKPALGIAVYSENNILDFSNPATYTSLKVGGTNNFEPNLFRNCFAGVVSLETPSIDIQNNTFHNFITNPNVLTNAYGLYGVLTRLKFYSFYEVNGNTVNNCETGIHFLRNSKGESFPQDANILDNKISGGNTGSLYCNTGIMVEDVVPVDLPKQINVMFNRSNNAAVGIHTRNVNQVVNINENDKIDVKPNVTTLSYHAGIRAEFCGNLRIIKNEKIKSTNNTDVRIKGIYLTKNSQKPEVVCNKVNTVGQGIVFENNNGFAFFDNNTMQNCFDGYVLLNNGSIGQQGGPGNPSDNKWMGNFGNSKTLTVQTFSPQNHSVLYVRNGGIYNPTGTDNQTTLGDDYNTAGAKIVTTGPFELCNAQHIVSLPDKKNFVAKLITEAQPMIDFVNGSRWAEKAEAYKWIKEDYNIASGDTVLENFYTNADNGCFGLTDSIDHCMKNGNYASAQILNSLQNPVNQTEQNHKDFVEVATGYDPDSLSSTDSIKLFEIAVQCPLDGGYVVYAARGILNHYYKNNIWFDDFCESGNRFEQSDNNFSAEDKFRLYPNPNDGSFTISQGGEFKSGTQIHIVDIAGKTVFSSTINKISHQVNLHIEALERGVYIVNIIEENRNYHLRFVVSK